MYHRNQTIVDGVRCEVMSYARPCGSWCVAFERELAGIEDIEKINWAHPTWSGDLSMVPVGYGLRVEAINYDPKLRIYNVRLAVLEQYWGDVTGYQAEIKTLNASLQTSRQETAEAKAEAAAAKQQAEEAQKAADAVLEAAYTEGVNTSDVE